MDERAAIESQRKKLNSRDHSFYEKTSALYEIAQNPITAYLSKQPKKRRKIIRLIFTDMELENGELYYKYTPIYQKLKDAVDKTNSSKVSGNEEFKKEILEQGDFVAVKANVKGFEPICSSWLGDRDSNPNRRDQNPQSYH